MIDSLGMNPRLELMGDEYVVHISQSMARVLRDSLPGFSPLELSAWDPAVVSYVASRRPGYVLPSVVIGDFNGDSKLDLAMMGNAREGSATFMLLAESDSAPQPRILYIGRGESRVGLAEVYISLIRPQIIRSDPTLERQPLDLKTDAVLEVVIEKASLLYYLDHGTLRNYAISD